MLTDYHCHLLPGVDDGAKNADVAVKMLALERAHGVERVVATPHFYGRDESVDMFLSRRQKAFDALSKCVDTADIIAGAEVAIKNGISGTQSLERLSIGNSRYILLELPYVPLKDWMITEIYNIAYSFSLIPVIAHVDRYLQWYDRSEISSLLSLEDAVIQINNHALQKNKSLKFALEVISQGLPVVFGSDAHNLDTRPPDFAQAFQVLRAKLGEIEFYRLLKRNRSMLEQC